LSWAKHVTDQGSDACAAFDHFLCGPRHHGAVNVGDNYVRALACQSRGNRFADALRSTYNDRDLTAKPFRRSGALMHL
jgi:hypothetical protein